MPDIKATIYCYGFNLARFSIPYRAALTNFCAFADEVICATIPDEDDSPRLLRELAAELPNLRVIESDVKLNDNRFDGKLKTAALAAATHPIRIIADLDERFPLSQRAIWQTLYARLLNRGDIDGFLIPVLDLYGSPTRIRADTQIGQKFRVHKASVVSRGVLPEADHGARFDTSKSDSTEPLARNGRLANFASITSATSLYPILARSLVNTPYVIHEGYLDLEARARINAEFWKKAWEERSGRPENVKTDVNALREIPTIEHGLPLE